MPDFQLQLDGTDKLAAGLRMAAENMSDAIARAMVDFGGYVEGKAVERTPIDTGELRSRAFVAGAFQESEGDYTVIVGYESFEKNFEQKYAVPVHERLTARHNVGQAKFLESAVQETSSEYLRFMADQLREVTNE